MNFLICSFHLLLLINEINLDEMQHIHTITNAYKQASCWKAIQPTTWKITTDNGANIVETIRQLK